MSFLVFVLAMGWYTGDRVRESSKSLESIYHDRIVCIQLLRAVSDAYGTRIPEAVGQVRDGLMDPGAAIRIVQEARLEAARSWTEYKTTYLTPHEARLVALTEPSIRRADGVAEDMNRLLATSIYTGVSGLGSAPLRAAVTPLSARIEQLLSLQVEVSKAEVERGDARTAETFWATTAFVLVAVISGIVFARVYWIRFTEDENTFAVRLARINSYYAALSQTNQLIVRESDPAVLLQDLCRICVEHGRSKVACVYLKDGTTATRFAIAGADDALMAVVPTTVDLDNPARRRSMIVKALTTGMHAISQDYQREAPSVEWQQIAARAGVHAAASFPLRRGGEVIGALALYAAGVGFFEAPLVQLLDEMAEDLSFALDNAEREAERTRQQKDTLEILENFKAVFRASPVSGAIAELATGVVLEANDAFCERYGVTREEIVGHTMYELGIGMLREDAENYRATTLREGRVRNMEVRTHLRDGGTVTVLANTETIQYQGRACLLSMTMDVTELRRAAAAREAQIEAEAANRAKTDFLSRMSHELRTPLNAMLGFTQLMLKDARDRLTARDMSQLDHIYQAGWHLLSLVNDVLDVSRIESGSFDVQPRTIALAAILDEAMELSITLAQQSGISLRAAYRNLDDIGVHADPLRLKQAVINLLSNAIKYNRPGGSVHIEVRTTPDRATVEVVDTGLGMTHDQLAHLYEPFNRLGRERGGIEGTGLGLALTRQLVRQMGGDLQVESQAGHGTRAKVALQRAEAPAGRTQDLLPRRLAVRTDEPSGTVLYIEDNDINVMVVEQMLARWSSVKFVHASDGRTGIEQAVKLRPDLILLDMQLPDIDGHEVLKEFKRREETSGLYVAVLSASAMEQDVSLALADGAQQYWAKPLNLEQFLSGVAEILAGDRAIQ